MTARWNERRRRGEPRLMCGWAWEAKTSRDSQTGINSKTAAYIFAHAALVARTNAPSYRRIRLAHAA